ncbi:MAG: SCO family protein [Lentisphaeraceae bacterium]|nr:SCO family protein [Lentisphaeraceae bacterium]
MIRYWNIALLFTACLFTANAQILDKPVAGDFEPMTPTKYTDGIVNPAETILNSEIPSDILFRDSEGNEVTIGSVLKSGKPSLLCMMYMGCRSTCGPLMNDIYNKIKDLNVKPGSDFNLIFVSMEPKEGPELAQGKKANYLKEFNYSDGKGQYYLTGSKESVTAITKALDFKFAAIDETGGFDYSHPTVTYYITPDAKISRFLTGFGFSPQDIKFSLLTAGEGKVGSLLDNILVRCYKFDPQNKRYVRNSMMLMSIAGAVTLVGLAIFLGFLWYHDIKNNKKTSTT